MRVLLVANTAASMVWFRMPLLRALREAGHQVWVMAPDGWGVEQILEASCSFLPLPHGQGFAPGGVLEGRQSYFDLLADAESVRAIRRACLTVRPDVVLSYTHKMALLTAPAARSAGVRRVHVMVTGLGYANLGGGLRRDLLRRGYHLALAAAAAASDSVIVLNRDNLEELAAARIASRERLFLLDGEGVDTGRYVADPPEYEVGKPMFLMVARLVEHKGVLQFVEAARAVAATHPQARFALVGSSDGRHPDAIPDAMITRWRAEGVVELTGQIDDVRPWLRQSTCFVLPSLATEGLPMSLMEAMAASRPLITTDAPGNREAVVEGVNGFLVPQRDAVALAEKMRILADDPELALRMGAAGRARALRRFDHAVINDVLMTHLGL